MKVQLEYLPPKAEGEKAQWKVDMTGVYMGEKADHGLVKISAGDSQAETLNRLVQVAERADDDMDHAFSILQFAFDDPGIARTGNAMEIVSRLRQKSQVDGARLVFDRDKGVSLGGPRPLTHQH